MFRFLQGWPVRLTVVFTLTCLVIETFTAQVFAGPMPSELQHLVSTHPRLQAALRGIDAAKEGQREARSAYFPTVSLSGDVGRERVDSPSRRDDEGRPFENTRKLSTLTVTQNIFEGFRTDGEAAIAGLRTDVAELDLDINTQTLLFQGVRSYIDVLRQSRLHAIAKENERTLQEQLRLESARVERGSGLTVDVLQAKSRLQLARERVVTIFGQLQQALARYLELFGKPAVPAEMKIPDLPRQAMPETLDGALSIAMAENAVLKRSGTQIDIASEQRDVARSTYWPRIDLVGEGSWGKDIDGVAGTRREGKVVVRAVWDLFDGFRTSARSSKAMAEYGAALDSRMAADREVRDRVRRAWEVYRTTGEQVKLLENAVNIAAEVFGARQKLRQRGRETAINVLDAENELNSARLRLTRARFAQVLAGHRVLLQIGRLTPETLSLAQ